MRALFVFVPVLWRAARHSCLSALSSCLARGDADSVWTRNADLDMAKKTRAMAQHLHAALGVGEAPDRISTIDADGAILSALRGLSRLQSDGVDAGLRALNGQLSSHERAMERHEQRMSHSARRLALISHRLEVLERSADERVLHRDRDRDR